MQKDFRMNRKDMIPMTASVCPEQLPYANDIYGGDGNEI